LCSTSSADAPAWWVLLRLCCLFAVHDEGMCLSIRVHTRDGSYGPQRRSIR
jgi:hypothetical protein